MNKLRRIIITIGLVLGFLICYIPQLYAYSFWGLSPAERQGQAFWYELRDSFRLKHYTYRSQVAAQIYWFQNHQKFLHRILTNAAPYLYYIYTQVMARHLPGELVLLPVLESEYDPFAYSNRGAAGLWQLMPGTASGYGLKQDWWYDGRRDIYASTNAALGFLTYLQSFFNGDWLYAIAAYDAGEGTIQQAIVNNAHAGLDTDFWGLALPHETRDYVPRLLALAAIIENPGRYGVQLPDVKNEPYFAAVNIGTQIDLSHAAKLAGISIQELYNLNPGFNRWATDPNGPYRLLLPINKIDEFKRNLSLMPVANRIANENKPVTVSKADTDVSHRTKDMLKQHYDLTPPLQLPHSVLAKDAPQDLTVSVKSGDTLWKLARRYHVTPKQIKEWNHLKTNSSLGIGKKLIIHLPHQAQAINAPIKISTPAEKTEVTNNTKKSKRSIQS